MATEEILEADTILEEESAAEAEAEEEAEDEEEYVPARAMELAEEPSEGGFMLTLMAPTAGPARARDADRDVAADRPGSAAKGIAGMFGFKF